MGTHLHDQVDRIGHLLKDRTSQLRWESTLHILSLIGHYLEEPLALGTTDTLNVSSTNKA